MGKYKNFRKRNKSKAKEQNRVSSIVKNPSKVEPRSLHADLVSLDDYRRLSACRLLANIFGFSSNNVAVIEKLANSDIISRLVMRLLDSNRSVQFEAIGAVSNLSKCIGISKISGYIVSCGTLTTLTSITLDFSNSSEENNRLTQQLLTCLGNLISCDEDIAIAFSNNMISAFNQHGGSFLSNLVQTYAASSSPSVVESAADFLLVITDDIEPLCKHVAALGLLGKIYQLIDQILVSVSMSVASGATESSMLSACHSLGVALKFLSVLVNLSQFMSDQEFASAISSQDGCVARLLSTSVDLFLSIQPQIILQLDLQVSQAVHLKKSQLPQSDSSTSESTDESSEVAPTTTVSVREPVYSFTQTLAETIGNLSFVLGERLEASKGIAAASRGVSSAIVNHLFVDSLGLTITQVANFVQRNAAAASFVEGASYDTRILTVEISVALEMADKLNVAFANLLALHQISSGSSQFFSPEAFVSGFSAFAQAADTFFSTAQKAHNSSEGSQVTVDQTDNTSAMTDGTDAENFKVSEAAVTEPTATSDPSIEMIDYSEMHELALSATCSSLSCISAMCQDASTNTLKAIPGDLFQSLCLHLCKGIAGSFPSVIKSSVELISQLASRDNDTEMSESGVTSDTFVVSHRLNALFTNALVRKLDHLHQLPHCDNSSLQLVGMSINALIDLHSSDDGKILDTYVRFKLGDVLTASRKFCIGALAQLRSNSAMADDDAELEAAVDDSTVESMISEVIENAKNLIDYKKSFLKSSGKK